MALRAKFRDRDGPVHRDPVGVSYCCLVDDGAGEIDGEHPAPDSADVGEVLDAVVVEVVPVDDPCDYGLHQAFYDGAFWTHGKASGDTEAAADPEVSVALKRARAIPVSGRIVVGPEGYTYFRRLFLMFQGFNDLLNF